MKRLLQITTSAIIVCTALSAGSLFAVSRMKSFIVQPYASQTILTATPSIIGYLKTVNGNPMKNRDVIIVVDGIPCGQVRTDKYGVFFYQLRNELALASGKHEVHAFEKKTLLHIPGGQFMVDASRTGVVRDEDMIDEMMMDEDIDDILDDQIIEYGTADVSYSYLVVPYDGEVFNTTSLLIIISVNDSSNNPVVGEHVTIYVDEVPVATGLVTDNRGLVLYELSVDQTLSEGLHAIYATLDDSVLLLATNNFVVATGEPAAPIITDPMEEETVMDSTVFIVGTSQPNVQITVFIDGDFDGQITFADENGDWEIEYDNLTDDTHSVYAFVTDEAETEGPISNTIDFTVSA